jgi:hypothetical protein
MKIEKNKAAQNQLRTHIYLKLQTRPDHFNFAAITRVQADSK